MRNKIWRMIRFAPLVAVVAAAMVGISAFAAGESIQPTSATLLARGATVDVTLSYVCPAGDTIGNFGIGGILVNVQQAVTKTDQAFGGAMAEPTAACTGSPQSITVQVPANVPGPPFRSGPATVQASINGMDSTGMFFSANSGIVALRISK